MNLLFCGVLPQLPECRDFFDARSPLQLDMRTAPFELCGLRDFRQKRHIPFLGTWRSTA